MEGMDKLKDIYLKVIGQREGLLVVLGAEADIDNVSQFLKME